MAYIGVEPGSRSIRTVTQHTATANQSVFNVSGGYVKGFVDVFKQGQRLTEGTDFTANDNITVNLTANASLNDKVDIVAFSPLAIYSVVSKAGDAMTGSLTLPNLSSTANVIGVNGYFTYLKVDSNTVVNSSLHVTGNTVQTGDYNLTGNINLTGSLTITGAATSVSTQSLNVQDSIIIMASNNSVDTLDIGFAGRYNNGSANVYTGMVRNATNKEYYVFEEYDTVPGNDIDLSDPSFKIANLHANFNGNLISNSVTVVALNATNGNFTSSITLTGDASGYRQDTTTIYGGDAGAGFGRLEYHNNQWILNAGSDSSNVVAFQRGNLIKSHIDNNGAYNGPLVISGTVTANGGVGTSGQVLTSNSTGVYWSTVTAGATPGGTNTTIQFNDSGGLGGSAGLTFNKTTNNVLIANTLTVGTATVNSTFFSQTANNTDNLGGVAAANYVQNTDSRTLSGNLVISGTYFNPGSNTVLLGNSTQRWVLSANTGSFSGAVSGITTLDAGNTTITGFANASISVNSALLTVGTSFIANTTGAYHTGTVNAASHTIGTDFIANTVGVYHTGTVNAASHTTSGVVANTSGVYPSSNTVGTALGASTNRWNITANAASFSGQVGISDAWDTVTGAGAIYLDAATGNRIDWNTNGVAAPAVTTRSAGTKLVLYPGVSATSVDYGIGVETNNLWLSAADTDSGIKLYANTTQLVVANTSGITVGSGGIFPTSNSSATSLGSATQRWVLNANTGSFAGAVSGITTLGTGNTTVTGFVNATSSIQGGSSLTIAGALSGVTTADMGNTTITGFANASVSVNSALLTVGTNFIANTTGAYHTGTINATSYTTSGVVANTTGLYPASNTTGTALGSSTRRWILTANSGTFESSVFAGAVRANNFYDSIGAYNVNLGSSSVEGRGVVAGYSGGSYSGVGYNIRHTTTTDEYAAPGTDPVSYMEFASGGFAFRTAPAGTAGRSLYGGSNFTTIAEITSAGQISSASIDIGTGSFTANSTAVVIADPLTANGTTGTSGQVLTSNGATGAPYWATSASGGVTSITAGSGLSGGTITTSGTIAVTAGTGVVANATGVHIGQAVGTTSSVQFGSVGVGTAASGTTGEIRANNNITAFYTSDKKYKENIRDIENALDAVNYIGGKTFNWKDKYIEERGGEDGYFVCKQDFGVIAQDVEQVFPLAVRKRGDGTLAVDYDKLSALAFAAIKQQQEQINDLKTIIQDLEAKIYRDNL